MHLLDLTFRIAPSRKFHSLLIVSGCTAWTVHFSAFTQMTLLLATGGPTLHRGIIWVGRCRLGILCGYQCYRIWCGNAPCCSPLAVSVEEGRVICAHSGHCGTAFDPRIWVRTVRFRPFAFGGSRAVHGVFEVDARMHVHSLHSGGSPGSVRTRLYRPPPALLFLALPALGSLQRCSRR
jgi:hypothetical protein